MKSLLVVKTIDTSIKWIPKIKVIFATRVRRYFWFTSFNSSSNAVCDTNNDWAKHKGKQGDQDDCCSFHDVKYVTHDVTTQAFCLWLTTFILMILGATTK
jgi:hypothetical protein